MQSTDIENIGKKYIPYFKGVWDINQIPVPEKLPAAIVVNTLTSGSNKIIGHWFSMIIEDEYIKILDSAGIYAIKSIHLKKFIARIEKPVITNKKPLQAIYSSNCGVYCLVFLYHQLALRNNFTDFLNIFNNDKDYNDNIACNMFRTYFHNECSNVLLSI